MKESNRTDANDAQKTSETPRYQTKEDLQRAYDLEEGNLSQTATHFDASYYTVRRWLVKFGIHTPKPVAETSSTALLEELNPEDVGLTPIGGEKA